MSDNISKVDPESLKTNEKGLSLKKKVVIASAVAAGVVVTGVVLYGSGVFSSKKADVSNTRSDSDALEALVASLPTAGKLEDKDVKKLTTAFDKMTPTVQIENLKNPKVAQAVLGNNVPLKVAKMDAKQKQELGKDLIKIQNDSNTPDEVKKAAKELQEIITEVKVSPLRKKQPPGGGGGQGDGGNEDDSGTGGPPPPNKRPTKNEGGESDQGEGNGEDSGSDIPPPAKKSTKKENGDDASKKSAEIESLLVKPFNGPKDVVRLIEELNKGTLVKPDGTKYVLDEIKEKCSISTLIKPLLEAADPKALPKLDSVRKIITVVQKELKEVSDVTVKSYFKEFDHADDKSTLVTHLSNDLENLKGNTLAARFALLKSIDPATFNDEYAKDTLLKKALSLSSEDLAITFKDELELLSNRKELIELVDKTKDVDKMIAEAKTTFSKMDNTLKTLVKFDVLEPSEVKKALEVAGKINKAAVEDIKKKCKIESFIENLLKYEDPNILLPFAREVEATKALVKEMRTKLSSLPDTDPIKSLYESLLKNESGTVFKNENEAIEACLEKDIQTLTGEKLYARYRMLNSLNKGKYNETYAKDTILRGALDKTPVELAKIPDFKNFLTQRQFLISKLFLKTFAETVIEAEQSMLTPDDQNKVKAIHFSMAGSGLVSETDYEYLKKMLMDNKELKISDNKGEQLTLENLAEKCSPGITASVEKIQSQREILLNSNSYEGNFITQVNVFIEYIDDLKKEISESHADILKYHGFDATTDPKKQEENILAKDVNKLKRHQLLSRYLILNKLNNSAFDAEYAKNTLIGKFTKAELESDPAKLSDICGKTGLCYEVHYQIDGEAFEIVVHNIITGMLARFDSAPDKQELLKNDPILLKAALFGFSPMTELVKLEAIDQYVTKNLDALLGDMADRKELVKKAMALQTAINSHDVADASSGLKYAMALAEYLKCEDVSDLHVQKKSDLTTYNFKELVADLVNATEKNAFFSAILDYDDASFVRIMNEKEIHGNIKIAVRKQINRDVKSLEYVKGAFEKNVQLLKRILMKEPSTTCIEPVSDSVEDKVTKRIAEYYLKNFSKALHNQDNSKKFDEAKLKSASEICHTLNFKVVYPLFSYDALFVPVPMVAYLKNDSLLIDFSAKTFDDHAPVKTYLNHVNTNSSILFVAFSLLAEEALERTQPRNIREFWLNKVLVHSFDLLPSTDFYDLKKLPDEILNGLHKRLFEMGDQDHDLKFKAAYIKALTDDTNKNKDQNILYLWGVLDKETYVPLIRKQLENLKLANISNENIIKARERLLTKKTEGDATLKALYKTHYEALKKMYSGPDRDTQFPNNW